MLQIGDRVRVIRNAGSWLHAAIWWPENDIYGTVTKVCKNGSVYVACDFMPNKSIDGKRTKVFSNEDNVTIIKTERSV